MANLTFIKPEGKSRYIVTSNDVDTGWITCALWGDDIIHVHDNGVCVEIHFIHGAVWEVSFDGADNTWQVDDVDGDTTISDNAELAILIEDLRG